MEMQVKTMTSYHYTSMKWLKLKHKNYNISVCETVQIGTQSITSIAIPLENICQFVIKLT